MRSTTLSDVTRLLEAMNDGDPEAGDRLIPIVYDELRRLATAYMRRERGGHTLQPTTLVHEAYLKLVDQRSVLWQGRSHFFGIAAQAMRRILVDHARRRTASRRGGGRRDTLLDDYPAPEENPLDLISLDVALEQLMRVDARQARTVELRFFGGLSVEETARVLGVSQVTVKRDWRHAKAWLYRAMEGQPPDDGSGDAEGGRG